MATAPTRRAILDLYTTTLRTSRSFSSYNFREYFMQRTKERFRALQVPMSLSKGHILNELTMKRFLRFVFQDRG